MLYFENFDGFVEGTGGILGLKNGVLSKDSNRNIRLLGAKNENSHAHPS